VVNVAGTAVTAGGDPAKAAAAKAAVALVRDGMTVGLGSGSTAALFHALLGERIRAEGLRVRGVPPSAKAEKGATEAGIELVTPTRDLTIDLAIDGADECDPARNLIKGGGGALVREKIVAANAREFVVIADAGKDVPVLGKFPLPVAIFPYGYDATLARLEDHFGIHVFLRGGNQNPFVSDDGLYVADLAFGAIPDPAETERALRRLPGVAECGLFVGMAHRVYFGHPDGSVTER
jgi:ribose 5-phosphate isomerase A